MTLLTSLSFGRVVGSFVNSVPVVSLSANDLQGQIDALLVEGFTNVQLVEMHLTFTASEGGFFFYTFTFNAPNEVGEFKLVTRVECTYDGENNEFTTINGGSTISCRSKNCDGCLANGTVCTACSPTDIWAEHECEKTSTGVSTNYPWDGTLMAVIDAIHYWLAS